MQLFQSAFYGFELIRTFNSRLKYKNENMKRNLFFLLLFACIQFTQADLLTDITDGKFRPKSYVDMYSLNDGEHYTVMKDNKLIIKYNYKTGKSVDTILDLNTIKKSPLVNITGYTFSPNENKILVYTSPKYRYRRTFTANYYIFDVKRNELKPLSENGPQEAPLFSPDSRYIAFARENNLYLHKLDFGTESAITKDGEFGKIINGTPDWVYEEEFTETRYFVFSPDSKLLAFIKFNETDVPTYSMQQYLNSPVVQDELPLYPTIQTFKYPNPGQNISKASVCVYDDFYKSVRTINIDINEKEFYIPRIKWTADQEKLAIFVMNRYQNRLDLYFANPKSLISKLILSDEDSRYVDYENSDYVQFTPDGKYFTFVSVYNINGTLNKQLTKGNWDVTKVYGYNAFTQTLYYQSAETSPIQRDIFSVDVKGRKLRLTDGKGVHDAVFSKTYTCFADNASNVNMPTVSTLCDSKGMKIRILEDNAALAAEFKALNLPVKEFFSFTTSEGVKLNGWMLKPVDFSPGKKYPTLMVQYSGPNSQQVLDHWKIDWEYYLSTQGYVVVSVDGRGTGARGADFRKCTYQQLGVLEAKDQIEAARYLGTLSFVDKDRIGIWGWSFGGYMTLLSMSSGEKIFKAGIAVAPVTDWRLYDAVYTERFMRTPQENNRGYDAGSVLNKADKLNGNLLIVHGTADDNVHLPNTMIYLDKLMKSGKHADLQLYTDKNHSILGKETRRHLYQKKFDFLEKNLK
ncbi:MAG: dipeptidyl-peptidase [Bacteroidetes bacterium]|nr:dipeptidyl-peptidase [Bacteroidota bacterium]